MTRGIKLAAVALLFGIGAALGACSTNGQGYAHEVASCTGAYPSGGGIMNMSPYSPNADPFQPDCEAR